MLKSSTSEEIKNKPDATETMPYLIHGGKLSVADLQGLLSGAYDGREQVGDWELDKDLSTSNSKVYYNPKTKKAVVAHKGTSGLADWYNNAVYAVGGTDAYKKTKRYKDAEKVQNEAIQKYGAKNISTIGHSQAELLGKDTNEIITLNKATRPFSNTKANNQYDIRTDTDVVSGMNPFQKKTERDITIKADTYNPLVSHDVEQLEKLHQTQMVGQGVKIFEDKKPFTTSWREVLYYEKELQNKTYPQMMADPKIKQLYNEVKTLWTTENPTIKKMPKDWAVTKYKELREGKAEPIAVAEPVVALDGLNPRVGLIATKEQLEIKLNLVADKYYKKLNDDIAQSGITGKRAKNDKAIENEFKQNIIEYNQIKEQLKNLSDESYNGLMNITNYKKYLKKIKDKKSL